MPQEDDFGQELYRMSKSLLNQAKELQQQSGMELAAAVKDVEAASPSQQEEAPAAAAPRKESKASIAQVTKEEKQEGPKTYKQEAEDLAE